MKKLMILSAMVMILIGGCTAKEINGNIHSITGDVTDSVNKDSVNKAAE